MTAHYFKGLVGILSVMAFAHGVAGSASEPTLFGEWSEASHGVRARLALAEEPKADGLRLGVLYLEVQNLSQSEPVSIYYPASQAPLRCQLRDPSGQPVAPEPSAYSGWIAEPCWLWLPHDSTLRFRAGLSGFGVAKKDGLLIAGCIPDCWVIPAGAPGAYALSGTLSIAAPKDETRPRIWTGTLQLPPLQIRMKAP